MFSQTAPSDFPAARKPQNVIKYLYEINIKQRTYFFVKITGSRSEDGHILALTPSYPGLNYWKAKTTVKKNILKTELK